MAIASETLYESYQARSINRERMGAVVKFAGESILDVGCGSGVYVLELAERYQIRGVDYQPFPTWKERPDCFSVSDASQLDFDDNSVDTVISFETLEHLLQPQQALAEFYRVCKKNLILTVPNCEITSGMKRSKLIYNHWIDPTHVNFFTMDSLKQMVEEVGFNVEHSGYINHLRLKPFLEEVFEPPTWWSRRLLKLLLKQPLRNYHLTCLIVAAKL
jgi:ubiquinone/menaquinone biosynthesis C-methylase UbiE